MARVSDTKSRRGRVGFGIANLAVGAFVAFGVFRLLPTRWWLVDGGGAIIGLLLLASGVTLLLDKPIAERLTRAAALVVLGLGLATFAALAITASWIHGVYGPVGRGGSILFALVAALVLPYLVAFPAAELLWIGPRGKKPSEGKAATIAAPAAIAVSAEATDDDPGAEGNAAS